METKGQTIFLSVVGIATLLVAIVGASFSWFSVSLQGEDKKSDTVVSNVILGKTIFNDGNKITIDESILSSNNMITKTFSISNTNSNSNLELNYNVYLEISENNINDVNYDNLTYSLTSTTDGNGKLINEIKNMIVPKVGNNLIGTGSVLGKETHNYILSIKVNNADKNALKGKKLNAAIVVKTVDEE